jgi:predicted nucleic acid-binding protein
VGVTYLIVLSELLHVAEKYGNRLQRLNIIKSLLAHSPCVHFVEVDATYYATIRRDLEPQGQVIGRYDQ